MKKIILLVFVLFGAYTISLHAQAIKGNFAIKNVQTGLLLRIKDANTKNGTPIVAYTPQNWKCMTWHFTHVEGNTYQLKNLFSSKSFTPQSATPASGTALEEQPLAAGDINQQYEFILTDNDSYLIKQKSTGLYLSATGNEVNSKIVLANKKDTPLQHWTIYNQEPVM